MGESDEADLLANRLLDEPNADPDDDLRILARQLLRSREVEERHRKFVEAQAEERHMLHGANPDGFWGCTKAPCKAASNFLRGIQ